MRRKLVALVCGMISLGLAAPVPVAAQEEAAPAAVSWETAIDGFFARLAAGEAEKAVDQLYEGYPYLSTIADQVNQLKTNFASLTEAVGEFRGQQRLAVERLSDRFVYVWYLAYFDRQPIQFHFSFYKPKDRWQIYQFSYDQSVTAVAQEMARRRVAGDRPAPP
jgi:hypothetical protein